MKIHMRFDESTAEHQWITLFIDGKNSGRLCMSPEQATTLHIVLCQGLHMPNDEFVSSGKPYNPESEAFP
jgi:hypothetical protein